MSLALPLKQTRIAVLTLATVSSIVAGAAGVNAIKKSDAQKSSAKHALSPEVTVTISTPDMEDTVIVLFVVSNLLSMQIGNFLLVLIKDWLRPYWPPQMTHPRDGVAMSTRTLGCQSWYLLMNLCAILAVLIPATIFAAHRMADVKELMEGVQLPSSVVQGDAATIGFAGVYWHFFPARYVIVSGWVNVLFTLTCTFVSFIALSRCKRGIGTVPQTSRDAMDHASVEDGKIHGHIEVVEVVSSAHE